MTRSNIWLIQTGEPLPLKESVQKMRTAVLADKLEERGHDVLWWSSTFDHFKKDWVFKEDTEIAVTKGIRIKALKGRGYTRNISLARFSDQRLIARKFRAAAAASPLPDIIITSTPPHDLAYQAVMFAREKNIPVLVDIRDQWPDLFLDHVPAGSRGPARLLLNNDFRMARETMKKADGLIAVTKSFLEWGLKQAGRKKTWKDHVFPLGYKKWDIRDLTKAPGRLADLMPVLSTKFIILYIGAISKGYHDPSILIKAAEKLAGQDKIHFVIAGDGELLEELREHSRHLPNVSFTGWLERDEIEHLLVKAKIGVCPATKSVELPTNKAFSYLSAGLPLISALEGELKELIEQFEVGLYYPPNDVDVLVGSIIKLHSDPLFYEKMSENARRLFEERFDSNIIYEQYAQHIEAVVDDFNRK